jgi:hypothetical protein
MKTDLASLRTEEVSYANPAQGKRACSDDRRSFSGPLVKHLDDICSMGAYLNVLTEENSTEPSADRRSSG